MVPVTLLTYSCTLGCDTRSFVPRDTRGHLRKWPCRGECISSLHSLGSENLHTLEFWSWPKRQAHCSPKRENISNIQYFGSFLWVEAILKLLWSRSEGSEKASEHLISGCPWKNSDKSHRFWFAREKCQYFKVRWWARPVYESMSDLSEFP